jgi:hypothetical protein
MASQEGLSSMDLVHAFFKEHTLLASGWSLLVHRFLISYIFNLFNDPVNIPDFLASNDERCIGNGEEGSGCGLIDDIILESVWRDCQRPKSSLLRLIVVPPNTQSLSEITRWNQRPLNF